MQLSLVNEDGLAFVEGQPNQAFLLRADDVNRLIETCLAEATYAALLYDANLPPAFFDLSSGEAGIILQKLRNYQIRLAAVYDPARVTLSSRFKEMSDEETRGSHFGLFTARQAAIEWLQQ